MNQDRVRKESMKHTAPESEEHKTAASFKSPQIPRNGKVVKTDRETEQPAGSDHSEERRNKDRSEEDTVEALLNDEGPREAAVEQEDGHKDKEADKERARKRKKVNHACVYCRRSHMTCDQERPCTRCIKRNIGHLCHDKPRELKKAREDSSTTQAEVDNGETEDDSMIGLDRDIDTLHRSLTNEVANTPQPAPAGDDGAQGVALGTQQLYQDWMGGSLSQLHDIHSYHPNYMFNTSEVTNEYNLLNDFLSTSLLDDGAYYQDDSGVGTDATASQALFTDASLMNIMGPLVNPAILWPNNNSLSSQIAPPATIAIELDQTMRAPISSHIDVTTTHRSAAGTMDKAQEKYYMTAADPAGTETPEVRMNKVLKAKYDAGLLKPFNYVKGYSRLNRYMERNVRVATRQRVLRQIDRFRPKFRERMQRLTDVELVRVEMWFERKLMEYDRVFASMAIPACCWRRTGEIFRANKEMAELIRVPLETLRDVTERATHKADQL